MRESIASLIEEILFAIDRQDFEAYKRALEEACTVNMFKRYGLCRFNDGSSSPDGLFGYLLNALIRQSKDEFAEANKAWNEVSDLDWINLMAEKLETYIEDDGYDQPQAVLAYFKTLYPDYFTEETITDYLRALKETKPKTREPLDRAKFMRHITFMRNDYEEKVKRLLDVMIRNGGDPNTKIRLGRPIAEKEWGCNLFDIFLQEGDEVFDIPVLYLLVHALNGKNDKKILGLIELLLRAGADPNWTVEQVLKKKDWVWYKGTWKKTRGTRHYPILTYAADKNTDLLNLLLKYGASTKVKKGCDCYTPLLRAVIAGNAKSVDLLLKHGADVFALGKNDYNVFHLVLDKEILDIILKHISEKKLEQKAKEALEGEKKEDKESFFYFSPEYYNEHNKHTPIYAHFPVDYPDYDKKRYFEKTMEIVPALIDAGADINGKSRHGRNVLHRLVDINHWDDINKKWMEIAVDLGANVNAKDNSERTPLIAAAKDYSSYYAFMGYDDKRDNNKKYNAEDYDNIAEMDKIFLDIVATLINAGADINAKDKDRKTVFDYLENLRDMTQKLKNLQDMIHAGRFNEELEEELYER